MCDNFKNDFVQKVMKYNCCQYCFQRFKVCKNLDSFYNHINPNHLSLLLRQYSADKDDVDTLLTALHANKNLQLYEANYLVKFICDFADEEYIIQAIQEHINCINNDHMPHIVLSDTGPCLAYLESNEKSLTFTEWIKLGILKQ